MDDAPAGDHGRPTDAAVGQGELWASMRWWVLDRWGASVSGYRVVASLAVALAGVAMAGFVVGARVATPPAPDLPMVGGSSGLPMVTTTTAAPIHVHVAGAIARPGLYMVAVDVAGAVGATWRASPGLRVALVGLAVWGGCWGDASVPGSDDLRVSDDDGLVVLVVDRPDPATAVGWVRRARLDRIDVVVARSGSRQSSETVRAIAARSDVGVVLAPAPLVGVASEVVTGPRQVGSVVVTRDGGCLLVEVSTRQSGSPFCCGTIGVPPARG